MACAGNDLILKFLTVLLFAPYVGLKALALLGVLPDGESGPDSRVPSVAVPARTPEEERAVRGAEDPSHAGPSVHCRVRHGALVGRLSGRHGEPFAGGGRADPGFEPLLCRAPGTLPPSVHFTFPSVKWGENTNTRS